MQRSDGHILKVYTKSFLCKSARMQARNRWSWSGCTQASLWIQLTRRSDRDHVQENTRRRSKVRFKEICPLLSCSLQCHHLKLRRCLFQSWCWWVGWTRGQQLKLRLDDISRAHFQGTAKRLIDIRFPAEDRQSARRNDKLDPARKAHLEWQSENWHTYFVATTSSSSSTSWSQTSTWWDSQRWENHQQWRWWRPEEWKDQKWWERE